MATTEKRTFVYGDFIVPPERGLEKLSRVKPPPGVASPYAIEILREFSGSEFIGKVYHRTAAGGWGLLRPEDGRASKWHQVVLKNPGRVEFEMSGSGHWKVENVRTESDIEGSYIAVALSRK